MKNWAIGFLATLHIDSNRSLRCEPKVTLFTGITSGAGLEAKLDIEFRRSQG
ncbi:hypothetical protein [uncultured Tessaracoccus sp.]|uniref:hypothetical protein n=1 Tax=uncultured Tessaracoccus sp. TaxID=905023 RepID=UPI0026081F32|nr:hypothetical protein [uncultured Tessaracoccus sp.]